MTDSLSIFYPRLAAQLPKRPMADLPTPLRECTLDSGFGLQPVLVKRDDLSGKLYGGNKIRKLEYLLQRAKQRGAKRVATFGTVASNHALATALYASELQLECTCLLSHQSKTPNAPLALNLHLQNQTEIVEFGGPRSQRIATMRRYLQGRHSWVIPAGGSSWLGVIGFVNAALELAEQIEEAKIAVPQRLYVANGTMGTAAGLALGLALANQPTEVHAARVTHESVSNPAAMQGLIVKTASMMQRLDPSIPRDIAARCNIIYRDEFFGDGYARSNAATDRAIIIAQQELGLSLETTYTGKAMATLLHDLSQPGSAGENVLFWNTYNSRALPVTAARPKDSSRLPEPFLRYYV